MQSKLKELLDNYIEENERLKLEYEDKVTKSDLYKELLSYFDNNYDDLENNTFCIVLLLNSIYNDNIYEYEDKYYAEYHSTEITSQIYSIFRNSDKVYIE